MDTSGWKPFELGELFDICKRTRLTKSDMEPGPTKFIGASAANNGCTAHVRNASTLHPVGTITTCYNGSVGSTFFQDEPFLASDDVNILKPRFDMDEDIALFLVQLIKTAGDART